MTDAEGDLLLLLADESDSSELGLMKGKFFILIFG